MRRPEGMLGMWHVALQVKRIEATERFYTELLGMKVEWRPDADNVYLTGGTDNLALHRITADAAPAEQQRLDHIGFILQTPAQVDEWHAFLEANGVSIAKAPKTHRDGARSFYCRDPDGTLVQMICHPPLVDQI